LIAVAKKVSNLFDIYFQPKTRFWIYFTQVYMICACLFWLKFDTMLIFLFGQLAAYPLFIWWIHDFRFNLRNMRMFVILSFLRFRKLLNMSLPKIGSTPNNGSRFFKTKNQQKALKLSKKTFFLFWVIIFMKLCIGNLLYILIFVHFGGWAFAGDWALTREISVFLCFYLYVKNKMYFIVLKHLNIYTFPSVIIH
jgi:hypothetical protein